MENKDLVVTNKAQNSVENLIISKANETNDINTALDLMVTNTALRNKETIETVVNEKKEELKNSYEAKRIQAEADRISKEVEKIKQEKEKELAELDKIISAKQKEVEQLKAESDKAQAFFESNRELLSYIGIMSKKTLGVMYGLMIPAIIVFILVQTIALPLTVGGKLLEIIIGIVAGVCKEITNNALKIIIAILVIALLAGGTFAVYYFGGKFIL